MPALTKSRARNALAADLGNIERQVRAGRPLAGWQRRLLEAQLDDAPAAVSAPIYVRNQSELARALGVSRQRIQHHVRRSAAPQPREDGRLSVSAWRRYLQEHGKLDGETTEPAPRHSRASVVAENLTHAIGNALPRAVAASAGAAGMKMRGKSGVFVGVLWLFLHEAAQRQASEFGCPFEPLVGQDLPESIQALRTP